MLEFTSKGDTLEWTYYRPGERDPESTMSLAAEGSRRFSRGTGEGEAFVFEDTDDIPSGFVEIELPGQAARLRFDRMTPPPDLDRVAGRYGNDDLGIAWELEVEGELIKIQLPHRAGRRLFDQPHKYVGQDTFVAPLQHNPLLRLHRGPTGCVRGFTWRGFNRITLEFSRIDS